jgi:hypothetical protein
VFGVSHLNSLDDEDEDDDDEDSFLEPMDENIMAHLLSREDESEEQERPNEDEEEVVQEGELMFDSPGLSCLSIISGFRSYSSFMTKIFPEKPTEEGDKMIELLRYEVSELQDLLKTEIVAHMKEMEMNNEQLKFVRIIYLL